MEPPSPIVIKQNVAADQNSDDPLSNNIYMVMGDASDEGREGVLVCAWSAHTGLSYVGIPGNLVS